MNDQTRHPDTKVSARRRLIRGVFAAPAALTLYSGSVAARSIHNCVTKQVANPDWTPIPVTAEGTTYVRVRLWKFRGQYNATNLSNRYSLWIKGDDVVALQAAGTNPPYLAAGQWQLYSRGITDVRTCSSGIFNPASVYATSSPELIVSAPPNEAGLVTCTDTGEPRTITGLGPAGNKWVALRVNANGDIVGVVGINNIDGTSAVWQSCWTSFRLG